MEILNYNIHKNLDMSKYFSERNICFLDIETTGLSRKYNEIYLIGIVYYNSKSDYWALKQFFANNLEEEKEILMEFNEMILDFDLIIHYNGSSFDLPFIESRMKYFNMKSNIKEINSFDIYREIRKNQGYLELDNLKLKTVEESLGIYRIDEYSGKDCINFYFQYTRTGDEILKENILRHNYEDLYYLLDILKIFDILKEIKSLNMNVNGEILHIEIIDIIIDENIFKIYCDTKTEKEMDIIHYDENFTLNWQREGPLIIDLNITEGLITPTKKCLFINKEDMPIGNGLNDLSQYMVPDNLLLLKVEKHFIVKNIKNIIENLIPYVL